MSCDISYTIWSIPIAFRVTLISHFTHSIRYETPSCFPVVPLTCAYESISMSHVDESCHTSYMIWLTHGSCKWVMSHTLYGMYPAQVMTMSHVTHPIWYKVTSDSHSQRSHVCALDGLYILDNLYPYIYIYIYIHVNIYAYVYIYIYMCKYVYVNIYTYIYIYIIYIYMYIYICIYIYIHI